jgi:tryptophan halogenase
MNNIKIVIVGGGTAGWMAAGFFSKHYDGKDITVIESPIIPKIGVGESVTPHVNSFFEEIGVDRHHWMKHTSAVYKFANKFVNWKTGNGETEYFSFTYTTPADNFYKDIVQAKTQLDFSKDTTSERTTDYLLEMMKRNQADRFDRYFNPQFHYMEKNVSPFNKNDALLNGPFSYSQHINAELAGNYIRDYVAVPRGVKHVVATVKEINNTGDNINFLILDNGEKIQADLQIAGLNNSLQADKLSLDAGKIMLDSDTVNRANLEKARIDSDKNGIDDFLDLRRTDVDENYKREQVRIADAKLVETVRSNKAKEELMQKSINNKAEGDKSKK